MSSALEERWTPDQILGIARELLFECWTHSQESVMDNLYQGRLGAYWLLYELSRVEVVPVETPRSSVSVYRHKRPLQQARDGAYQVVASLPPVWSDHEAHFHYQPQTSLALLQSDWMGAHCLLCACEHRLKNAVASKKILVTIHQRLITVKHQGDPSVTKGTAGILQAILWLRQELESPTLFQSILVDLAVQLITEGIQSHQQIFFWPVASKTKSASVNTPTKKREEDMPSSSLDLGASRGTVGILFTLLGCSPSDWTAIHEKLHCNCKDGQVGGIDWIQNTINHFVNQVEESMANKQDHVFVNKFDWAHGTCGYVLLLLQSGQVFQQQSFLQHAAMLCEWMWDRPQQWSRRLGLAFGSSAMALCFLQLAKVCPKPTNLLWQRRAEFVLQGMIRDYKENLTYYGLYDGLGGLVSAIFQLHHKVVIEMPLYCQGTAPTDSPPLLWQPCTQDHDATIGNTAPSLLHLESPLLAKSLSIEASSSSPPPSEPQLLVAPAYQPLILSAKSATTRSHFAADDSNEQAFFWSLQTESHIGLAEAYKPALKETKTIDNGGESTNDKDSANPPPPGDQHRPALAITSEAPQPHDKETLPSHPPHAPVVEQDPDYHQNLVLVSEKTESGTAAPPKAHQEEPITSQPPHPTLVEQDYHEHQNSVNVSDKKVSLDSLSTPTCPSPVKTTLSQRKPRPIPLEIHTPSHDRPRAPTSLLGGKVRLTRAAQLRMERIKKDATVDSQASSTITDLTLSAASIRASNRHARTNPSSTTSSRNSSNDPSLQSTNTSPEEGIRQRREDLRRKAEHLQKQKGLATSTQSGKLHAEEKTRMQKAKEMREQVEQQNRLKVQQQAKERAQRVALQKAQQNLAKELARKKLEGEKARLERAKAIRQQLEAANRAKVEMQTQWKMERLAKKEQQEMAKRLAMRVEKAEQAKRSMLQQEQDRRRIDSSQARILIKKLEKVEAVQNATTTARDAKTSRQPAERLETPATKMILEPPLSSRLASGRNTSPHQQCSLESETNDGLEGQGEPDLPICPPSHSPARILVSAHHSTAEDNTLEPTVTPLFEQPPTAHVSTDLSPSLMACDDTSTSSLNNVGTPTVDGESGLESTDIAVAHPENSLDSQVDSIPHVPSQELAEDPPCESHSMHPEAENALFQWDGLDDVIHPNEGANATSVPEKQELPGEPHEAEQALEENQKSEADAGGDTSYPWREEANPNEKFESVMSSGMESSPAVTEYESHPYSDHPDRSAEFSQEELHPGSTNKSSTSPIASSGFESIDAMFANVENALEAQLALILDPLPVNSEQPLPIDHSNETIPFKNTNTATSAEFGVGSDQTPSGLCKIGSAHASILHVDCAGQGDLGPSSDLTYSNGAQSLHIDSLNEFVGGCMESKEHASDEGDVSRNVEANVLSLTDSAGPAEQAISAISAYFSPCQEVDESVNTFPPDVRCLTTTGIQKSSMIGIGEIALYQNEEPSLVDGHSSSVPGDAFDSESVASPVIVANESGSVATEELAILEVGRSPEKDDPSPEDIQTVTALQPLTDRIAVDKRSFIKDDPIIIQSVSPDGSAKSDELGVDSPGQQGDAGVNSFPPAVLGSTTIQKSSAMRIEADNCEPQSTENEVVQHEHLLLFDGPISGVQGDVFDSESVAPPAVGEIESDLVSINQRSTLEVECPQENNDPLPEPIDSSTSLQLLTDSVDVANSILVNDDACIIQSMSPDGASTSDNLEFGTEPKLFAWHQGDEGVNSFPRQMLGPPIVKKPSGIGIGADNCEHHSAVDEVVQHEEPLSFDWPSNCVPGDVFDSESVASAVISENESNHVSIKTVSIHEVGCAPEKDDLSPEQIETDRVEMANGIFIKDDPGIIQSVSLDGSSTIDHLGFGTGPKECGYSQGNSPDESLIQSNVDVHSSRREHMLSLPLEAETQRQESCSPIVHLPNDVETNGGKALSTSWSSDTPDGFGFDELNQLFQEAENQLETELAATLGNSGLAQSVTKNDPSVTPRKPTAPVSTSAMKVSMLSRRRVAAATSDAQSSTTTEAPGYKWIERLQNSKNKAD